ALLFLLMPSNLLQCASRPTLRRLPGASFVVLRGNRPRAISFFIVEGRRSPTGQSEEREGSSMQGTRTHHPIKRKLEGKPPAAEMAITYRPIEALKPDPSNPRGHSRKQIRQIANSIESFGFIVPVLTDADNKVLAGHGRLSACEMLGKA